MKLITNTKKERLNHMLQAAKIINLEVVVGEPFEKEDHYKTMKIHVDCM